MLRADNNGRSHRGALVRVALSPIEHRATLGPFAVLSQVHEGRHLEPVFCASPPASQAGIGGLLGAIGSSVHRMRSSLHAISASPASSQPSTGCPSFTAPGLAPCAIHIRKTCSGQPSRCDPRASQMPLPSTWPGQKGQADAPSTEGPSRWTAPGAKFGSSIFGPVWLASLSSSHQLGAHTLSNWVKPDVTHASWRDTSSLLHVRTQATTSTMHRLLAARTSGLPPSPRLHSFTATAAIRRPCD